MDFHGMKRQALQSLCKKHGIPANLTNREMADRLALLLKENEKPVDNDQPPCSNNLGEIHCEIDSNSKVVNQKVSKKVRFSPENETFIFVSSDIESGSDHDYNPKRRLRKRKSVPNLESKKQVELSKNVKKAEISAKSMDNSGRVTRSRAQRVVAGDSEMVFSPLAGNKRGRRTKNVDVCDKPQPIADLGDKDDRCVDDKSRGGSIRWQLRSKEVVNEAGDLEVSRKNSRLRSSKNIREVKASDGVVLQDQIHEDNAIAVEEAKPEPILKRSKRTMAKDKGSSALSEDLGETGIGGRITRSRKVDEKDSAVESQAGSLVVEEESQKVLQLEEPAKGSRRKSAAPQNGRVQNENLACKRTERGQPAKGSRKRLRKIDSEGVPEVEPIVGIVTKDEDLLPKGPPRRSRRSIASFNSVATAVGELRTHDNDGKKKPQRKAPLDGDANIAEPPRRSSRNVSKEVGGTADGVRKVLQTKQSKEQILKEESSVTVHEPVTKKPLRRSRPNVSKSNVPELADLKGRAAGKNKQSKSRMEIIEEEGSFRKSSLSQEERPVIDVVPERGDSKKDFDLCQRKKVRERSNKKRKGFKGKSVESSQLGSAEISALNSDENEVTYATLNSVDQVSELMELERLDNEKENLNLDNNIEGVMEYQSCHSFNTRGEPGDENLVEQVSPGPSKINNEVSCGIISPASGFSPAYQEDSNGLKTEESLMGKHINPVSDKVDHLLVDNGKANAQEDKILLELDANGNSEPDQEETVQENHQIELSGRHESERSSEKFSNEAEKICVLVPYERNEDETVQENHLSELSGRCDSERSSEKFSNEAEQICVLVPYYRNEEATAQENHLTELSGSCESKRSSDKFSNEAEKIGLLVPYDRNEEETVQENHLSELSGRCDSERSSEKFSNEAEQICMLVPYYRNEEETAQENHLSELGGSRETKRSLEKFSNEAEKIGVPVPYDRNEEETAQENHLSELSRSRESKRSSENCSNEAEKIGVLVPDDRNEEETVQQNHLSELSRRRDSERSAEKFSNEAEQIRVLVPYYRNEEETAQENHLSELSGSRESKRSSENFSNEAEKMGERVPYDRNEEETVQENHLSELSGSHEPKRSSENFSIEAEKICVLVPYDRNGIAQVDEHATETADIGVEKVADIQLGIIASDDTAAAPSEPAPQSQDGNQLEALTTIHPEIVGRSDAYHVERENCSNNLIEVPDETIVSEDISFSKVGGQVCSNVTNEEVGTMKEKESEEALNNGLVLEVIYEGYDKDSLLGGSVLNVSFLEDKISTESKSRSYKDNEDLSDATTKMDVDNNVTCQEFDVIQENMDCETTMEEQSLDKYPFTSMHGVGTKEAAEINGYSPAAVEETEAESIEKPGHEEMSKNGEDREAHVITNKITQMEEVENGAPMLPLDSMGDDTAFSKCEIELSKTNGLALGASDVTMSSEYEDGGTPNEIVATVSQVGEFKFGSSEKQGEVLPDLDKSASIYSESCLSCDGKTANKEENVGKAVDDPKAQVISFDAETKDNDVNDHLVEKEFLEQNDNGPNLTLRNTHESSIYATDEGGDGILDRRLGIENVEDGTELDEQLISPFRLNNGCLSNEKSPFVKSFSVTPSGRNVPGSSRATFSMQNFSLSCGKECEFDAYSNCVRNDAEGIEMAIEDKGFGHEKVNPPVQGENELGIGKRVEGQNSNEGTNDSADGFAVENNARTSPQVVPEKLDGYTNVLKLASQMDSDDDLDLINLFNSNSTINKRNLKENGEQNDLHDLENVAISSGKSNDFLDFGNNASILKPEMDVECSAVSPVTASRTENKALEIDAELALFTSYELNFCSEDRERDEFEEADVGTLKDKLINKTNEEVNEGREIVSSIEKFVKEQHCDHEQSMVEVIVLKHTQLVASDEPSLMNETNEVSEGREIVGSIVPYSELNEGRASVESIGIDCDGEHGMVEEHTQLVAPDEPNLMNETNEVSEGREIVGSIVSYSELHEGREIVESIGNDCADEHGMVEELEVGKRNHLSASDEPIYENGSIPKEKGGVPVIKQGLIDCEIHKFQSIEFENYTEATHINASNYAASDTPRAECCASDSKKPEIHVNSAVEAVAPENPQKLESHEDKSPEAKLLESISRSAILKMKTHKDFSIPRTPKSIHKIYDMKENFPTSKREQVNNMTATKTSVKRRALEDLQNN